MLKWILYLSGFFIFLAFFFYFFNEAKQNVDDGDLVVGDGALVNEVDDINTSFNTSMWNKVDSGKFLKEEEIKPFKEFDRRKYENALIFNSDIFLYFYSGWCSICVGELPMAIRALENWNGQNILAFRVNFDDANTDDEEKVIAKELDVDHQYTKVFIKDGKVVLKDGNPWMNEDFVNNLALYFK